MNISYEPLASVFKALADENRLRILHTVGEQQLTVSQIVQETELSQPLVSHHLKLLRDGGVLKTERKGPFVYYSLAEPALLETLETWNEIVVRLSIKSRRTVDGFGLPRWCGPMRGWSPMRDWWDEK